jgi:crotonobetainyl-CoA:carnitine CoA-transferase CaiB-like acyl-CoA transferase
MNGAHEDARIVDLCSVVSGPAAIATLADQGGDRPRRRVMGFCE